MNDLISRQAAIHEIHKQVWLAETAKTFLTEALNELPSTDVVEVVRCKDCKHYAGEGMYCAYDIIVQYDHFYCYHWERKDED